MKEYRIFHRNGKSENWCYYRLQKPFKTLEKARQELAKLRAKEERNRKAGKTIDSCGGFAIESEYPKEYFTEYKIGVREVTPFELTED